MKGVMRRIVWDGEWLFFTSMAAHVTTSCSPVHEPSARIGQKETDLRPGTGRKEMQYFELLLVCQSDHCSWMQPNLPINTNVAPLSLPQLDNFRTLC